MGETIAQGSFGGALVSAANLDDGVQEMFETSKDEVSYGSILIRPILYQDDIFRATTTVMGAQNGLNKISKLMGLKQLEVHPEKTGHVTKLINLL